MTLLILFITAITLTLVYFSLAYFGHQALVVRSGSMEPTIPTGSILVLNLKPGLPPSQPIYKTGDIITFDISGEPNTHRIVKVERAYNLIYYQTKGDANQDPDEKLVYQDDVVGKKLFFIPKVGHLVQSVQSPLGVALFAVVPAFLWAFHRLFKLLPKNP